MLFLCKYNTNFTMFAKCIRHFIVTSVPWCICTLRYVNKRENILKIENVTNIDLHVVCSDYF